MSAMTNVGPQSGGLRGQLGGLAMPTGILAILAMMILPLPAALLDVFFVSNILLSLLVLMVAVHSQRPLDFSSFPSLLLIATTLRLALNVASTRVVLAEGHNGPGAAGAVIEAFASFVVGGNFIVGLLVFVILVIINMVVIAKGAGRVSEVSARFTLDAMPGKQMAIDADLNAGLMSPEEAKARRAEVAAEADFYGSMDGASKFVKGDAIAGLIILAINVVGGIIIGTTQHGLSVAVAGETYVRLSVGDGLVAQVPGLLLSLAAAIIVTRSSSSSDMGGLISKQVNIATAWAPAAAVLFMLGLVPGMPNLIFLLASALAAIAAVTAQRRAKQVKAQPSARPAGAPSSDGFAGSSAPDSDRADSSTAAITAEEVTDMAPLSLQIGYGLISLASGQDGGTLVSRITAIRRELSRALGIVVPGVRIRDDLSLPPNTYRIRIGQTIVAEDMVQADRKLAIPGHGSTRKLAGIAVKDPSFGLDAVWIMPHQRAEAEADDHTVVDPEAVVATHMGQVLQRHAGDLLGPDDVQALLTALAQAAPTLVETVVPKLVPLHMLTAVMRQLLADRLPVADLRRILEGLAQMADRNMPVAAQAESLRPALVPLLLQQMGSISATLKLVTFSPELEQLLMRCKRPSEDGLTLDPDFAGRLLKDLGAAQDAAQAGGHMLMIVVTPSLRRSMAAFLRPNLEDAIVLSLTDLPENRRVEVTQSISLPSAFLSSLTPSDGA
ncbi:flagellar biosynthesis protein FlhA [Seohaeicola saemankumensis]|uniref:flagellar biosynthesis protein FlhA n=1 Tax=Seohaeicola saemankumensis TaxID=481181 RepID=UPI001E60DAB1|nr:flagellar biosynthesis protein FlhA [Seohaeicola saemankumensis]MCD1625088.1 flagellar biosynthesis protein FlhA [Seohaeicola saemankumensis]